MAWTLDRVLCFSSCSRTSSSASWRDGKPSKTQQLCECQWGRTETWGRGWWVLSSCGQASATRRHLSGSSSLLWRARCLLLSGSKHLRAARDSWKQLCMTRSSSQALLHAPQAWGGTGVGGGSMQCWDARGAWCQPQQRLGSTLAPRWPPGGLPCPRSLLTAPNPMVSVAGGRRCRQTRQASR